MWSIICSERALARLWKSLMAHQVQPKPLQIGTALFGVTSSVACAKALWAMVYFVERPARIIVLNGPSSAGKSTLAAAVREQVGPGMAAVGIDRLFAFMHPESSPGWQRYAALTDATFRAAAAIADGGFDVVVETVFERAVCVEIMQRALGERAFWLVAVSAPLEVLEAREQARGNRRLGQAREQFERGVFHDARYDLRLDTHAESTKECVERLLSLAGFDVGVGA